MSDDPKHYSMKAEPGKYKVEGQPAKLTIRRGELSYTYFYVLLGFALGFVWTLIQVWEQPWKIAAVTVTTAIFVFLFLFNGRFQNELIKLKIWYEGQSR